MIEISYIITNSRPKTIALFTVKMIRAVSAQKYQAAHTASSLR